MKEDDFLLRDIPTDDLLKHLLLRAGCPNHIKAVIRDYLEQK